MGELRQLRAPKEIRTQEQRKLAKFAEIPEEQIECRGGRHKWPYDEWRPRLEPRHPDGMDVSLEQSGVFYIAERCLNGCGRERHMVTAPGRFGVIESRQYKDPDGTWVAIHETDDLDIRPSEWREQKFRLHEDKIRRLFGAAQRAAAPEAAFSGSMS
jgi:hypothetical protein